METSLTTTMRCINNRSPSSVNSISYPDLELSPTRFQPIWSEHHHLKLLNAATVVWSAFMLDVVGVRYDGMLDESCEGCSRYSKRNFIPYLPPDEFDSISSSATVSAWTCCFDSGSTMDWRSHHFPQPPEPRRTSIPYIYRERPLIFDKMP